MSKKRFFKNSKDMKRSLVIREIGVLMSIISISVNASNTQVGGIYYNFDGAMKTAEVTYKGAENDWMYDATGEKQYVGDITIPEKVVYEGVEYTVTKIGKDAFIGSKLMTSLSIPKTVIKTGTGIFSLCNKLSSITVDEANPVFFVYEGVMYTRSPLAAFFAPRCLSGEVKLHDGITSVPPALFQYNKVLTSVTIPQSVKVIENGAFESCTALKTVNIGEGVTTIERSAFSKCESLASFTVPKSMTQIDAWAFNDCCNLVTVHNLSDLDIKAGSEDYGYIAYYAAWVTTGYDDANEQRRVMAVYDLSGNKTKTTMPGVNIVVYDDGSKSKVLIR